MYRVEFVPIRDSYIGEYIPGSFIVRLKVQKGNRNEMYSFRKEDRTELFAFRTENEVLTRGIGQEILEIYRQRMMGKDSSETDYLNHPGPCRPV